MQEKTAKNLEEKVELIKSVVRNTLEELDGIDGEINRLQKKKAALRRDLTDLKEGRLDRIEERQGLDSESKSFSVFTVVKKVTIGSGETNPWYIPYFLVLRNVPTINEIATENLDINNSMTKINAAGSYKLQCGKIAYL